MSRIVKLTGATFTQPGLPNIWDPGFLAPNVVGWWMADYQLAVNGSNQVTAWTDQSGLGNTLTNAAPASSLVMTPGSQNGRPMVASPSPSTGGWVTSAAPIPAMNFQVNTPFCVAAAIRRQLTSPSASIEALVSNNQTSTSALRGWMLRIGTGGFADLSLAGASGKLEAHGSTVLQALTPYGILATYDGSGSAAGIQLYLGGVAETMTVVTNTAPGTIVNDVLTCAGTAGNYRDADFIGEALVLNIKPSTAQIASISSYFKRKWGL
jgi:hypothetical protein